MAAAVTEAATISVAGDHPAVKIIALLQRLQAQTKEEGELEATQYSKFQWWCSEMTSEKENVIKKANEEINTAKAQIQALTEDIAQLDSEIDKLGSRISSEESAKSAASSQRNSENSVYLSNKADIEGTTSAISTALTALDEAKPALVQRSALQLALPYVDVYAPKEGSRQVHAFLQARKQDPVESAGADQFENRKGTTVVTTSKTGGITEVLKKMRVQMEDKLAALNVEEAGDNSAHALADNAKQNEIDAATRSRDRKIELKGAKGQDKSEAESNLEAAENERNAAKTILDETTSQCRTRADEWAERSKRRMGELEAMQQAVEVLEKVTGVRSPESKGVATTYSFLQKIDDPRAKIVNLLRKAGNTKSTVALAKLADKIAALRQTPGKGTFDQIKNMIQKMIFHLMSEQKDEDDHKHWCDKELEVTTLMQEDKTAVKAKLEADIASLTAQIESLLQSITGLQGQIQGLDAAIEEETANRHAAKAENDATIKDAQTAQNAVGQAVAILTEFYKSTGGIPKDEWEAFVQLKTVRRATPAEPEAVLWDSSHSGTEGGSDVVGLLENIASDFATMEAEAKSDETTQQDEYDEWLTGAQINKSEMQKDQEMKTARKERLSEKLQGRDADNTQNQKELEATDKYMRDLQRACVNGDSTYAERKAARTQETDALRSAQQILEEAFAEE